MQQPINQPTTTANTPLYFFLEALIGDCQENPEIISDNAKSRGMGSNADGSNMMDASGHSTSSMGGSSRWESIPNKDSAVHSLRRPSREVEPPSPKRTATTPTDGTGAKKRQQFQPLKQPIRTRSFDGISILKDGMMGRRAGHRSSTRQGRKAYLVPSSPPGTAGAVHEILGQAMKKLELTASLS